MALPSLAMLLSRFGVVAMSPDTHCGIRAGLSAISFASQKDAAAIPNAEQFYNTD